MNTAGSEAGIGLAGVGVVHGTYAGILGLTNTHASVGVANLAGRLHVDNAELDFNLTAFGASAALALGDHAAGNNYVVLGADGYGGVASLWLRI